MQYTKRAAGQIAYHSVMTVARFMYLKVIPEELIIQLGDLELVGLLSVHDPGTALPLRVHQHRVPSGPSDHDTILDTQVICGQTLYAQL